MVKASGLSPDELQEAERVIRRVPPGLYTLADLYGRDWDRKVSPTKFGRAFKAAVIEKRLTGITLHPHKTAANAIQYLVHEH
ncbi:hypothetical protein [Phenylobacterium kunshanense]|uniref:Uncharacterized protein n=1 Tax=Phenylobacterium kunshanense TaxID=1445034 RepID=A0A328BBS2_9CAUL|nr:hypothetical protein [Phenylobacterium kunshanense]RAK63316.1 hypothetical protein DJ019_16430 [Phenylobacterium kunshanense]